MLLTKRWRGYIGRKIRCNYIRYFFMEDLNYEF